jgi:predicted ferric reductase
MNIQWKKLIAGYVGLTSVFVGITLFAMWLAGDFSSFSLYEITHTIMFIAALLGSYLSYYLWYGKSWSHKALVVITGVTILALSVMAVMFVARKVDDPFPEIIISIFLSGAVILTPVFILLLLLHPDVRAEYYVSKLDQ